MEGGLAAPVRLGNLDGGAVGNVELDIGLGPSPDRDDRRMLEEDDRLGNRAL